MFNVNNNWSTDDNHHPQDPHYSEDVKKYFNKFIHLWHIDQNENTVEKIKLSPKERKYYNNIILGGIPQNGCSCSMCESIRNISNKIII